MAARTVRSVKISDVEKRRYPNKHYVYVISVQWSDGTTSVIFRRYSQFFELQTTLLDLFPVQSGKLEPEDRIIPFLPGKILFGRSNTRDVAIKRQPPIDEYCKKLVALPAKISECDEVVGFFEVNDEDIHPPKASERTTTVSSISDPFQLEPYTAVCDYIKVSPREVSLKAGMAVEVIEKNESGWWLVSVEEEQGWVPSTYLERKDGTEEDPSIEPEPGGVRKYICSSDYKATNDDELSLTKGCVVEVLRKTLDGWWWIRYRDREGWAPATYLDEVEPEHLQHLAEADSSGPSPHYPVEIIRSLHDVSTLDLRTNDGAATERQRTSGESADEKVQLRQKDSSEEHEKNPTRRSSSNNTLKFSSQPPRRNTIIRKAAPKRPERPKVRKEFWTIADFENHADDGLSFCGGQQVKVLERNTSGWWYVEIEGHVGWVPSTYIEEKAIRLSTSGEVAPLTSRKLPPEPQPEPEPKPLTSIAAPLVRRSSKQIRANLGPPPEVPRSTSLKVVPVEPVATRNTKSTDVNSVSALKTALNQTVAEQRRKSPANIFPLKSQPASRSEPVVVDLPVWGAHVLDDQPLYEEVCDSPCVVELYVAVADYERTDQTEISFRDGDQIEVVEKSDTGWWLVRLQGEEGWAPATYLETLEDEEQENNYEAITFPSSLMDRPMPSPSEHASSSVCSSRKSVNVDEVRDVSEMKVSDSSDKSGTEHKSELRNKFFTAARCGSEYENDDDNNDDDDDWEDGVSMESCRNTNGSKDFNPKTERYDKESSKGIESKSLESNAGKVKRLSDKNVSVTIQKQMLKTADADVKTEVETAERIDSEIKSVLDHMKLFGERKMAEHPLTTPKNVARFSRVAAEANRPVTPPKPGNKDGVALLPQTFVPLKKRTSPRPLTPPKSGLLVREAMTNLDDCKARRSFQDDRLTVDYKIASERRTSEDAIRPSIPTKKFGVKDVKPVCVSKSANSSKPSVPNKTSGIDGKTEAKSANVSRQVETVVSQPIVQFSDAMKIFDSRESKPVVTSEKPVISRTKSKKIDISKFEAKPKPPVKRNSSKKEVAESSELSAVLSRRRAQVDS